MLSHPSQSGVAAAVVDACPRTIALRSRVLVAEVDPRVAAFVRNGLRSHGYAVSMAVGAEQTVSLCLGGTFDLAILGDQPGPRDSLEVLEEIRGRGGAVPILVLSGPRHRRDVVEFLQAGADDHMSRPYRFDELLARVRVRLRRAATAEPHVLNVGRVRIDTLARCATVDGRTVPLGGREFVLLETLVRHAGQVLSRDQLLAHIWGNAREPSAHAVNVCVGALCTKVGRELIETVRGTGYRFAVPGQRSGSSR